MPLLAPTTESVVLLFNSRKHGDVSRPSSERRRYKEQLWPLVFLVLCLSVIPEKDAFTRVRENFPSQFRKKMPISAKSDEI